MKYLILLLGTGGLALSGPYFQLKYRCDKVDGTLKHMIYPHPGQCQQKMYFAVYELTQACRKLDIKESYCGY